MGQALLTTSWNASRRKSISVWAWHRRGIPLTTKGNTGDAWPHTQAMDATVLEISWYGHYYGSTCNFFWCEICRVDWYKADHSVCAGWIFTSDRSSSKSRVFSSLQGFHAFNARWKGHLAGIPSYFCEKRSGKLPGIPGIPSTNGIAVKYGEYPLVI